MSKTSHAMISIICMHGCYKLYACYDFHHMQSCYRVYNAIQLDSCTQENDPNHICLANNSINSVMPLGGNVGLDI